MLLLFVPGRRLLSDRARTGLAPHDAEEQSPKYGAGERHRGLTRDMLMTS